VSDKIILIDCQDEKGIVYKTGGIFFDHGLNIEKNDEFVEVEKSRFFMRTQISGEADFGIVESELREVLPSGASLRIIDANRKKNVLLYVTKEAHCLGDTLIRHYSGELNANLIGVIANHDTLQTLVERFGLPFFHISAEGISREEHEARVIVKTKELSPDILVLAKYMRILSSKFVREFEGKIVNIHHSFLPAFIGANPYRQAYERGVKIIGATAHFVNDNLDEGPIIAQDTAEVDHTYSWEDMRHAGRNIEKMVLAKALDLVLHDRVFVLGNKTVIF
jgi:formyltetrahydrofolate deformylase